MRNNHVTMGSALLFLAVAAGAFGAHGLRSVLEPDHLDQWRTAVEYQVYHGLGMLALAALAGRLPADRLKTVGRLFLVGIVFFSGSIYLLSTRELTGLVALARILGPITPVGGLLLLSGWAWLFITALRKD